MFGPGIVLWQFGRLAYRYRRTGIKSIYTQRFHPGHNRFDSSLDR